MRSILVFGLFLCFGLVSRAQENLGTYENTYIEKEYPISISTKPNDAKFTLYIEALSLDNLVSEGGFSIDEKQLSGFVENIKQAKAKYEEWIATAKANNVTSLDKDISVTPSKVTGYFHYGSKWNFDFSVKPTFSFKILEDKGETSYLLIVRTGKLTSSSNEYINCDGFVLTFLSVEEIDAFLKTISQENINEYKNKPKTEDLFKD